MKWTQRGVILSRLARLGPFRRVVDHGTRPDGTTGERYECGHLAGIKQDAFGETVAVRRRCRCQKCRDGRPADVVESPIDILPQTEVRDSTYATSRRRG
jgi:hypothetical protein